jgi:phosphoserine phosphatase
MEYVVTLAAAEAGGLDMEAVHGVAARLGLPSAPHWLCPGRAADIAAPALPGLAAMHALQDYLAPARIDVFAQRAANRHKKLLLADMDSTVITGETLDEIAALAGIAARIAPITERVMRGEIEFIPALEERVALLAGIERATLQKVLEAAALSQGAEILARTMKANGATCVLVSGGFTFFTEEIARRAGFDASHGNVLGWEGDRLTGKVVGAILDKDAKLTYLRDYRARLGLAPEDTLAIGDGSNDLAMLAGAGLGLGYHPKPLVRDAVPNCILHGDLTAALYAQGYKGEF